MPKLASGNSVSLERRRYAHAVCTHINRRLFVHKAFTYNFFDRGSLAQSSLGLTNSGCVPCKVTCCLSGHHLVRRQMRLIGLRAQDVVDLDHGVLAFVVGRVEVR